jgi:hypothetical protein
MEPEPDGLSDEQIEAIALAVVRGQGRATKEQIKQAIDWATDALADYSMLQGVLRGWLDMQVREDGNHVFKLTEQGRREAEALSR